MQLYTKSTIQSSKIQHLKRGVPHVFSALPPQHPCLPTSQVSSAALPFLSVFSASSHLTLARQPSGPRPTKGNGGLGRSCLSLHQGMNGVWVLQAESCGLIRQTSVRSCPHGDLYDLTRSCTGTQSLRAQETQASMKKKRTQTTDSPQIIHRTSHGDWYKVTRQNA